MFDVFARRLVGSRASLTAYASVVVDALEQALHQHRPIQSCGLVDQGNSGSQSPSNRDTERLAEAGVEASVGRVGDSCDNALAETINGLCTVEAIHRRGPWRRFETVACATFE